MSAKTKSKPTVLKEYPGTWREAQEYYFYEFYCTNCYKASKRWIALGHRANRCSVKCDHCGCVVSP